MLMMTILRDHPAHSAGRGDVYIKLLTKGVHSGAKEGTERWESWLASDVPGEAVLKTYSLEH